MLGRAFGRPQIGRLLVALEGCVGDLLLQEEPVPQLAELGIGEFLDLMGGVAALDVGTEGPALDRLGQDHGRGPGQLGRQVVGGVDLAIVEAPSSQRPDLARRSSP